MKPHDVCISNDRNTELEHVPGNVTAQIYRNYPYLAHPMYVNGQQKELFQKENNSPHKMRLTMHYVEQNNINMLPWSFKSLDLNPIEHI